MAALGGRAESAFLLNHDDRFFYATPRLAKQAATVLMQLHEGVGLQLVLGEAGVGKTCFLIHLVANLKRAQHGVIWLPYVPRRQSELAAALSAETSTAGLTELRDWLARFDGRPPIIIMDDLDAAGPEVIRAVRETISDSAFGGRFVGAGLPGLAGRFAPTMSETISTLRLERFSQEEAIALVRGRLAAKGLAADELFAADALGRIAARSNGLPERLVMLSGRVLAAARWSGKGQAAASLVDNVAAEMNDILAEPTGESLGALVTPATAHRQRHSTASVWRRLRWGVAAVLGAGAAAIVVASIYGTTLWTDTGPSLMRAAEVRVASWRARLMDDPETPAVEVPLEDGNTALSEGSGLDEHSVAPRIVDGLPDEEASKQAAGAGATAEGQPLGEPPSEKNSPPTAPPVDPASKPHSEPDARAPSPAGTEATPADDSAAGLEVTVRDELRRRGNALMLARDVAAARGYYERGAEQGDARAATAMGWTFDPEILRRLGVVGLKPDIARAEQWYRRGESMGDAEASALRRRLGGP